MLPRAQLAVRRDHVALWYRRAAGELWSLAAAPARCPVLPGAWLVAGADGEPAVQPAPASLAPTGELVVALCHPRSGNWVWATAEGLGGSPQLAAGQLGAVAALAWSWDGRRLYVATARGAIWSYPVASSEPAELIAELVEPDPGSLALAVGPAGLVVTTSAAVWGINVRQRRAARLLAWPALREGAGLPAAQETPEAPAIAVDARGWLYLADDEHVLRVRADGSGLALVGPSSPPS